jgi:hypothetical protein
MAVQEVRWDKVVASKQKITYFSVEMEILIIIYQRAFYI